MEQKQTSKSDGSLNWLNFFAADVATGVGPFLAVYLAANRHWQPGSIGVAIAAMGFATVIAQTPAGFLIDRTRHKRGIIVCASALMGIIGLAIPFYPHFSFVITAQVLMGIAGAFYGPTLIALAACLVKGKDFDRTITSNQAYNHAGNVVSAIFIGIAGRYTNNEGVFYCLFALAVGCVISTFAIRSKEVDNPPPVATSPDSTHHPNQGPVSPHPPSTSHPPAVGPTAVPPPAAGPDGRPLQNRPFWIFLGASFVFHFANAAMLPLVGQEISIGKKENASLYMSACIILAQLVMVPVTAWCGRKVDGGRKWLLLSAFIILPIRGLLYTLDSHAGYLVSVQVLDGVAAGIYGVVSIMVVNDLMGSGRHASLAQALLATAVGLGASLSNLVAGYIVETAGFKTGFLSLSLLAVAAMALIWIWMPETKPGQTGSLSNT